MTDARRVCAILWRHFADAGLTHSMRLLLPIAIPDDRSLKPTAWGGLTGTAEALLVAETAAQAQGPVLAVTGTQAQADRLEAEVRFFAAPDVEVVHFPDWETLPYDAFSPHQDIVSERLRTLVRLRSLSTGVVIVAAASLHQRLPPVDYVLSRSVKLRAGQQVDREQLIRDLDTAGYLRVAQVTEHGDFAVRGSIVDLFPMGTTEPCRIDFFDDQIETIRRFDPDTQLSRDESSRIDILPAREVPLDADAIRKFRQNFRQRFAGRPADAQVYRNVSEGIAHGGIEYYLPLFFDASATLIDYLPDDTLLLHPSDLETRLAQSWREVTERHTLLKDDPERPILDPHESFLPAEAIRTAIDKFHRVALSAEKPVAGVDFQSRPLPVLRVGSAAEAAVTAIDEFVGQFAGRILFTAESPGRREALAEYLATCAISVVRVPGWHEFLESDARIGLTIGPIEDGTILPLAQCSLVPEQVLFGRKVRQTRRRRRGARDPEALINELGDLRHGSPVVHEEYGVGRYLRLSTLTIDNVESEYLTLEYAGGDKLYVPVHSLHKITRYTGASPESAPLHRLGTDQWDRARRKAAERIRDVAAELLDVYARRAARQGHSFHYSEAEYRVFESGFPFEPTEDQARVIDEVIADMRSASPMDRVVCGDVGFGKTEVALRAAFIAVEGGKQVAMLVPTTLLAQQHYQTFADRFADWPIRIEVLSRFRSAREARRVRDGLADGTIDIVIGTHKLLQHRDAFRDIGLVIVDEEHRFGVRQKESIKTLRAEIDVLTLTATPIPRTLNMALGGLRELSLITTPPLDRLSIKTFVTQWNDAMIREACLREIKRGGQIFFVHNRVQDIERIAEALRDLVPEASIEIGHGQMPESQLEQVMVDFYHRRFNLLLCTTIIESGLDVPSANTMLINRADRFGLAQLHQLRGRVGRSHHRAYAYLIAPPKASLSADAQKRLQAIDSLEDLGAGFALASHDLEIRGAGELLGDVQSGQIHAIGFTLYTELLAQAVDSLRSGRVPAFDQPLASGAEINLHTPALLPEDFVPDVHLRLVLYKRIASAADDDKLAELKVELIDRFGLLPPPALRLLDLTRVKLAADALGVRKIDAGPNGGYFVFGERTTVEPQTLIRLVQSGNGFKMRHADRLQFSLDDADVDARLHAVNGILAALQSGIGDAPVASYSSDDQRQRSR